ncbi:hypothetical protein EHI48_21655 [Rhizobium sp. WSM1325]|nr:hypothetical protein EHI43_25720 [Rhizobium leguminosarum]RWY65237.1 hypothetical protein EHI46_31125 [Rhizobium leguminosarum]RWY73558.1 hypothetical protein EHI48_21655 [Rhizobium leguminosarum]
MRLSLRPPAIPAVEADCQPRILLFLFPAKTPMNRRDDEISAGNDDANYRPGLPRALSGRKVRVFGAW